MARQGVRFGSVLLWTLGAAGCGGEFRDDASTGAITTAPGTADGTSASSPSSSGNATADAAGGESLSEGSGSRGDSSSSDGGDGPKLDVGSNSETDGGGIDPEAVVYAHTNRDLYRIDPDTYELTHLGYIGFPEGINQLTDLAVDRDGRLFGISTSTVYEINPATAQAETVVTLDRPFNGLSFIPGGPNAERLVGSSQDGWLYEIDVESGSSTQLGRLGGNLVSSGDVVAVEGLTLGTVLETGWTSDSLADLGSDGAASNLRDLGIPRMYGLGFWGGEVFGFAESGEIMVITVATGEIEVVAETEFKWWGAGSTTSAPLTPEG